ncbi:MAG TPA: prepilin-type N-terminal cleavage/methylation domain-containing protein [Gammaproteobacteria bacterium]|nr:prepilin-type N-terminal cleavage/methylation domain-containing protein [Gammaproteobacteria bacterium]
MNHKSKGFTLIELAVVLLVVSLLLGGLLVPLSTQMSQRNIQTTQAQLDEIREALLGFAVVNGYLPCPTNTTDPTSPNYGQEDVRVAGACPSASGILPWKTLGVSEYDAWGIGRNAAADPWTGYFRYRVQLIFSNSITHIAMNSDPTAGGTLSVQDAAGNVLTSNTEPPVAIVYSTGPGDADGDANNLRADGANETNDPDNPAPTASTVYQGGLPTATFDDLTTWISRPLLYNRLIAAGRIP